MLVTNAGNLAARQRRRSVQYIKEIEQANRENAEVLRRKAAQFSQRQFFSTKQLAEMDHPYAVRAPRPPVRAHIINRQSGTFHKSWRVSTVRTGTDRVVSTVYNTAPWSKYMMGTKYMIARPILDEAMARTKTERDRNIKRARDRAYRQRLQGA